MADRFPGYDVLAKRDTPSWNAKTRAVVDERISLAERGGVLSEAQLVTLRALADRIVPQPEGRAPVNTVAILLGKIAGEEGDGYRHHELPPLHEAWSRGLDALEAEAQARYGAAFACLDGDDADALLRCVDRGETVGDAWGAMKPDVFFHWRVLPDVVSAFYAHPSAWSAIGFGGPASPRGYVRMGANRRDPWEAAEAGDGSIIPARLRNRHAR